jgi:hypothetical protein
VNGTFKSHFPYSPISEDWLLSSSASSGGRSPSSSQYRF